MHERIASWRASAAAARRLEAIRADVEAVRKHGEALMGSTDAALLDAARRARTGGPDPARVFALVREAARRTLSLEVRDVQLTAGFALLAGHVAEMHTGEGKTLAAVHAACTLALAGRHVQVLTVNDYLAERDAEWMAPIYRMLGVSVAAVVQRLARDERRARYSSDVTYVTAKEAGFDFLRDSQAVDAESRVHRSLDVAIVDEADSILIDESRIPMVLAGRSAPSAIDPLEVAEVVKRLRPDDHYRVDREGRSVELTEAGLSVVERALGVPDLYAAGEPEIVSDVANALHATTLLARDVDYIVRDGRIELIDELTGRVADQRQWPDGLQAALEAKEGVRVQPEGRILNTVTMQHFLLQYAHLAGMTATAASARDELQEFYDLEVLPVPRHLPCVRVDHADRVLATRAAKHEAVLEEILSVHANGQPIVVGTASVAESEELAGILRERGVACTVLNAKHDAREAAIVAEAGGLGAVTISTNMAGRGTDIRLGGADERDRGAVVALGGLHVVGTNRHESRRIDDQLRGRAGRQGDPGSSRFFTSLEDDLIVRYAAMSLSRWPVDSPPVRREIDRAQRIVDGQHFEIRRTLFEYLDLIDGHRRVIAAWRGALVRDAPSAEADDATPWPPGWLGEARPERRRAIAEELGSEVAREIERGISLRVIDHAWGDHLARLTELRASVHLNRFGGRAPLDVFRRDAADAFDALVAVIECEAMRIFEEVEIGDDGVDWARSGLETPSATWTYMINDQLLKSTAMTNLAYNPALVLYVIFAAPLLAVVGFARRIARATRRDT